MGLQLSVQIRNLLMPNKKIYESPDGGKTVYERDFGSNIVNRVKVSPVEKVYGSHPQHLLINKILPIDIFYKLFRGKK